MHFDTYSHAHAHAHARACAHKITNAHTHTHTHTYIHTYTHRPQSSIIIKQLLLPHTHTHIPSLFTHTHTRDVHLWCMHLTNKIPITSFPSIVVWNHFPSQDHTWMNLALCPPLVEMQVYGGTRAWINLLNSAHTHTNPSTHTYTHTMISLSNAQLKGAFARQQHVRFSKVYRYSPNVKTSSEIWDLESGTKSTHNGSHISITL